MSPPLTILIHKVLQLALKQHITSVSDSSLHMVHKTVNAQFIAKSTHCPCWQPKGLPRQIRCQHLIPPAIKMTLSKLRY